MPLVIPHVSKESIVSSKHEIVAGLRASNPEIAHLSEKDVAAVVEGFLGQIRKTLEDPNGQHRVTIRKFGTFHYRHRTGWSIHRDGGVVTVPEKWVVKFTQSPKWSDDERPEGGVDGPGE